jgi:hypothetical protein
MTRRLRALAAATSLAGILPIHLRAQDSAPAGWKTQLTSGSGAEFAFDEMLPGFHVTAKSTGGLVYPAAERATGRFAVDAAIVLFPDASDRGYGVFVGGGDDGGRLGGWTAFLVAGDGRFAIAKQVGSATQMVLPWAAHDAVLRRADKTVTNRLRVELEPDSVRFLVNGARLATLARSAVSSDGHVGLQFEEGLNVHVIDVDVTRRLLGRPKR